MTWVRLHKDGNVMGISTNAKTEYELTTAFAQALASLIQAGTFEDDWEFQFMLWLPQYASLVRALRDGHVVTEDVEQIMATGGWDSTPVVFDREASGI